MVFQRIVPVGRAKDNMTWSLKQQYILSIFSQIEKIEQEFSIDIYLEDTFPLCVIPENYRHFVQPCKWGIHGISLDMYGNVAKCCTDSRYVLGNIFQNSIENIWNSSRELNERREGRLVPQKCRQCVLYVECGGGCILASELNACNGDPLMDSASNFFNI